MSRLLVVFGVLLLAMTSPAPVPGGSLTLRCLEDRYGLRDTVIAVVTNGTDSTLDVPYCASIVDLSTQDTTFIEACCENSESIMDPGDSMRLGWDQWGWYFPLFRGHWALPGLHEMRVRAYSMKGVPAGCAADTFEIYDPLPVREETWGSLKYRWRRGAPGSGR